MALTIVVQDTYVAGNKRHTRGTMAFDDSYPTAGEAFTARQFGLSVVEQVVIPPHLGYTIEADLSASKMLVYYADYDAGADGPAIEFPDQTSLAALTGVRWSAVGT
jgi:hypothetical protein